MDSSSPPRDHDDRNCSTLCYSATLFILITVFLSNYRPAASSPDASLPPDALICEDGIVRFLIGVDGLVAFAIIHPIIVAIWPKASGWMGAMQGVAALFNFVVGILGQVYVYNSQYCKSMDGKLYWLAVTLIILWYMTWTLVCCLATLAILVSASMYDRPLAQNLRNSTSDMSTTSTQWKQRLDDLPSFVFTPGLLRTIRAAGGGGELGAVAGKLWADSEAGFTGPVVVEPPQSPTGSERMAMADLEGYMSPNVQAFMVAQSSVGEAE
ncbi:hypothetical protein HK101_011973, partial [Irineochytrium annulatum]